MASNIGLGLHLRVIMFQKGVCYQVLSTLVEASGTFWFAEARMVTTVLFAIDRLYLFVPICYQ